MHLGAECGYHFATTASIGRTNTNSQLARVRVAVAVRSPCCIFGRCREPYHLRRSRRCIGLPLLSIGGCVDGEVRTAARTSRLCNSRSRVLIGPGDVSQPMVAICI